MSYRCPHNMVNFCPLTADICWRVWGTPANFNGFRVLASVTARHSSSERQPDFAALNRGRHLYSAGQPSRWALAHILVMAALWNRTGHYIFALRFLYSFFFLSFFPRLISAAADRMSIIFPHMVWLKGEKI